MRIVSPSFLSYGCSFLAICLGASLGALLRWLLGLWLNAVFPLMPLGTLTANWLGGYLIGCASTIFALLNIGASSFVYLFFVTGFLGALTTFSAFTNEMGALIRNQDYWAALAGIGLHVGGSLLLFFLGIGTVLFLHHLK